MRTTLDIEDDVLRAAKELAERDGSAIGRVISALARKGLNSHAKPGRCAGAKNGFQPFPSRGEVITSEHIQNLMDSEGV